jgi:hypothetical protein
VILEVCRFNEWLIKMLHEYGCRDIVLVHPTKRATKKTDYRDANALGEGATAKAKNGCRAVSHARRWPAW